MDDPARIEEGLKKKTSLGASETLSDDEERRKQIMDEVWLMCEEQRQMHRLAFMYMNYRHFRYHIFPLSIITMISGILAFLSTADMIPSSMKEYLSLSVGILSILSGSIQSINQEARYESKAEMHKNASLGMKKIADQISLNLTLNSIKSEQVNEDNRSGEIQTGVQFQETSVGEDEDIHTTNSVAMFKEVYQQCLESCQSQIPVEIAQAFQMAASRLAVSLTAEDRATIKREFGSYGKNTIHTCLINEIFCAITDSYLFPLRIPRPESIVDVAMNNVEKAFQKEQISFQRVPRETTPLI